jgi:hypothetical protein
MEVARLATEARGSGSNLKTNVTKFTIAYKIMSFPYIIAMIYGRNIFD